MSKSLIVKNLMYIYSLHWHQTSARTLTFAAPVNYSLKLTGITIPRMECLTPFDSSLILRLIGLKLDF
jgi:hypothetical protein